MPRAINLMDRAILMAHETLWGEEPDQVVHDLPRLTTSERALLDDLRDNRIRKGLRLEQERIGFGWVGTALADALLDNSCRASDTVQTRRRSRSGSGGAIYRTGSTAPGWTRAHPLPIVGEANSHASKIQGWTSESEVHRTRHRCLWTALRLRPPYGGDQRRGRAHEQAHRSTHSERGLGSSTEAAPSCR
jgi:hypothetical protein